MLFFCKTVHCQGLFNFKGSNALCAVSQGLSVPYQFLENTNEQSCTQFSGLRSQERAPAWIPFSDLLLKRLSILLQLWNFILFNGWGIILLKIHKHAFLQIKEPCFTRDLGPSSHWLQSPGPGLWRPWQYSKFPSWWRRDYEALGSKRYFIRPHYLCFSTTLTSLFKMSDIVCSSALFMFSSSKNSFIFYILSLLIEVSMHSAFQLWKLYFCHILFLFLGPCDISPKKEVYSCLFASVWGKNRANAQS